MEGLGKPLKSINMETEEYLKKILENQNIANDSKEMKELQATRGNVESLLKESFEGSNPTIRYGGSKIKGTMIKESYDLDIICYFKHDDNGAGESLKDIYNSVKVALEKNYFVEPKKSALRLKSKDVQDRMDFHVDVVPGRYIDDSETDSYIYQSGAEAEKDRLKTNLDIHIKHIRDSGLTDVIRLVKLWKIRVGLNLKTFVLELLVVKYAKKSQKNPLSEGLTSFWQHLKDHQDDITVEDPANPEGNDLSEMLTSGIKQLLSMYSTNTLQSIENGSWEGIFGSVELLTNEEKIEAIRSAVSTQSSQPKPWSE